MRKGGKEVLLPITQSFSALVERALEYERSKICPTSVTCNKGLQSRQKHLEQRSKGELLLIRKRQIPNKKWARVEQTLP